LRPTWSICFENIGAIADARVDYDAEPVAAEMRATDLPDQLAEKLLAAR